MSKQPALVAAARSTAGRACCSGATAAPSCERCSCRAVTGAAVALRSAAAAAAAHAPPAPLAPNQRTLAAKRSSSGPSRSLAGLS